MPCVCCVIVLAREAFPAEVDFASQHPNSLLITLFTDRSVYALGSPVLVSIKKKNISNIPLHTHVLDNTIDYDIVIRHGASEMEPYPLDLRTGRIVQAPLRPYTLAPGATVTDPGTRGSFSPIADWGLTISAPGTYVLTAISRETKQRSNDVRIMVTP